MKAILSGSMALPLSALADPDAVRKAQTHRYLPLGETDAVEVKAYKEDSQYLYVPRQYGLSLCQRMGIPYEDRTSRGCALSFPRCPSPRPYQVGPLSDIEENSRSYFDFVFRARTGFGKTISSLIVAQRLGMSTLIVVDQTNLKDQWVDALVTMFGLSVKDIGILQGKTLEPRPVTVAMIHTLSQKTLPKEVYDYFGFVIVDEVHTAGAPTFSSVLSQFSATFRLGISATPKRRDGLQKLLEDNLGPVRVYVADEHSNSSVYVRYHDSVYSWYANSSPKAGRYLTEIAEDGSRNLCVASEALWLYQSGRDTLVLSDRIEQLVHLRNLCYYLGVPDEDMGVYTGQHPLYGYEKQVTPPRRPPHLVKNDETGEYEYCPVELKLISKKTPKRELQRVKDSASLIFATYQMFSKGMDVPRLAAGVDATPRSQAEQVHGRILREVKGKQLPIWVTVADSNSYRSLHQLAGRMPDYVRNNATVYILDDNGGTAECPPDELLADLRSRVEELKSARIETPYAGLHTIKFPALPTPPGRTAAPAIRPRRRPPDGSTVVCSRKAPSVKLPTRTRSTR